MIALSSVLNMKGFAQAHCIRALDIWMQITEIAMDVANLVMTMGTGNGNGNYKGNVRDGNGIGNWQQ